MNEQNRLGVVSNRSKGQLGHGTPLKSHLRDQQEPGNAFLVFLGLRGHGDPLVWLSPGHGRSFGEIRIPTAGAGGAKRFAGLFAVGNAAGSAGRSWFEQWLWAPRRNAQLREARSIVCGVVVLVIAITLNRIGYRLL